MKRIWIAVSVLWGAIKRYNKAQKVQIVIWSDINALIKKIKEARSGSKYYIYNQTTGFYSTENMDEWTRNKANAEIILTERKALAVADVLSMGTGHKIIAIEVGNE